jgi:hypothetical protein
MSFNTIKLAKVLLLPVLLLLFGFTVGSVSAANVLTRKKINKINLEGALAIKRKNLKVQMQLTSPVNGQVLSAQNLTPNTDGSYDIDLDGVKQGMVNVTVKVKGFLPQTVYGVDVSSGTLNGFGVPLLFGGDVNNDGIVDEKDAQALKSHWNQSLDGYDLNGDGVVNSLDFAILKNNLNKTGQ